MKKNSTGDRSSKQRGRSCPGTRAMGLELGDKSRRYGLLDSHGEVVEGGRRGDHEPGDEADGSRRGSGAASRSRWKVIRRG